MHCVCVCVCVNRGGCDGHVKVYVVRQKNTSLLAGILRMIVRPLIIHTHTHPLPPHTHLVVVYVE